MRRATRSLSSTDSDTPSRWVPSRRVVSYRSMPGRGAGSGASVVALTSSLLTPRGRWAGRARERTGGPGRSRSPAHTGYGSDPMMMAMARRDDRRPVPVVSKAVACIVLPGTGRAGTVHRCPDRCRAGSAAMRSVDRLVLEPEADLDRDLRVLGLAVLDPPADLGHLEPVEVAHGLAGL